MVKGWKAKRHLALYVSVALSCGGGYSLLDSPYVYGADVTGGMSWWMAHRPIRCHLFLSQEA